MVAPMGRFGLRLTLPLALLAFPASAVGDPTVDSERSGDLDGDPDREVARELVHAPNCPFPVGPCADDGRLEVEIADRCQAGPIARRAFIVDGGGPESTLELIRADSRAGREVFWHDTGDDRSIRLIAWRATGEPAACRKPRLLFVYDAIDWDGKKLLKLRLRNRTRRFPGR
jgi:hypothetical protein